jgi:hypothetical protein
MPSICLMREGWPSPGGLEDVSLSPTGPDERLATFLAQPLHIDFNYIAAPHACVLVDMKYRNRRNSTPVSSMHVPSAVRTACRASSSVSPGPQTPAMAAGLTDHIWSLRDIMLFRVLTKVACTNIDASALPGTRRPRTDTALIGAFHQKTSGTSSRTPQDAGGRILDRTPGESRQM